MFSLLTCSGESFRVVNVDNSTAFTLLRVARSVRNRYICGLHLRTHDIPLIMTFTQLQNLMASFPWQVTAIELKHHPCDVYRVLHILFLP